MENKIEKPNPSLTSSIKVLTFCSSLGGFLFGYDCAIISGAMILLKKEYNLSTFWQQLIVSSTLCGALVGSLAGGFLNDLLGRKSVILVGSVLFTVGAGVLAGSPNKEVLVVGQLVVGLGVGKLVYFNYKGNIPFKYD